MDKAEKVAIALTLTSYELSQILSQRQEIEEAAHRAGVRASAPSGCVVHELTSSYYGSHSEYGEGDRQFFVAIPEGTELPGIDVGHGHFSDSADDLALLPVGSYVNWGGEWEPVLSWRVAVSLAEPLVVPDGYVVVEATIQRNWKPDGTVQALQPVWKARNMEEGQVPIVHAFSALSHDNDVEYVERRSDKEHWWESARSLATD